MEKNKMVLKVHKVTPIRGGIVRIHPDTVDIIHQMQAETGLTVSSIVSECIRFASQNYEIKEI